MCTLKQKYITMWTSSNTSNGFFFINNEQCLAGKIHCSLEQKVINNLKFIRNTYENVFTVTQERLQNGSVLLRISQTSPLSGVRTPQNRLHLINILERNFHRSIVTQ